MMRVITLVNFQPQVHYDITVMLQSNQSMSITNN